MQLKINNLRSGGLITNYFCSSKCKHCLYACSPERGKEYVSQNMAESIFQKIHSMGCSSVHIGGGEPFLNFPGLQNVVEAAVKSGIGIEYIETNSSWYKERKRTVDMLAGLKSFGVTTLLISISPFHNEFIPFDKVLGLIDACYDAGIRVFAWTEEFYSEINSLDTHITHHLNEYKKKYGIDYLEKIPGRYWTHFGGRAVYTYSAVLPNQSLDKIKLSKPCNELDDTSHFHIDLYGNYIPGLCSGFSFHMENLTHSLDTSEYFLINLLYSEGVSSLLEYAEKEHGYKAKSCYLNKCHLCNEIRMFLNNKNCHTNELLPAGYYQNLIT
jgi:hypothetical protein